MQSVVLYMYPKTRSAERREGLSSKLCASMIIVDWVNDYQSNYSWRSNCYGLFSKSEEQTGVNFQNSNPFPSFSGLVSQSCGHRSAGDLDERKSREIPEMLVWNCEFIIKPFAISQAIPGYSNWKGPLRSCSCFEVCKIYRNCRDASRISNYLMQLLYIHMRFVFRNSGFCKQTMYHRHSYGREYRLSMITYCDCY